MIRGPYKRYLRDPDPIQSMPKRTSYDHLHKDLSQGIT